ncbi:EAL domain-containing protein [Scytonema sp. UIC 10036]|uniref:two-component system response regulator n=1 Tax=Scytonema sp. UIC 10036 TaxID=2304196 RepID=UPI0012DACF48|nr:EAL domain-containing protein [Scytonema sp. UIC 10036]MUG99582.1 EAL domain-containing protein [Scytonema sp. UIC 10036]
MIIQNMELSPANYEFSENTCIAKKVNILLVDNCNKSLLALEATLDCLKQNLVKANSGYEALRFLLNREFAVILLNPQMTEMDGFETAKLIRQRQKTEQTPIIFILPASSQFEDVILKDYGLGLVDYIFQPISAEILIAKVKAFVDLFNMTVKLKQQAMYFKNIHKELQTQIAARQTIESELRKSLKNLSDIQFALDSSAIVGITDAKGVITYVNDKFCEISKYLREELIGKTHQLVNSNYHSKEFFQNLWLTICQGKVWQGEIKNKAKDGTYYWVDTVIVPFLDSKGKPFQYLAIRFDITSRKQAQEKLQHQVFYDALTGLPNRVKFLDCLSECIKQAQTNYDYHFAVLYISLNRYQLIKYSLGHCQGEQLLIEVACRLLTYLCPVDILARVGEEEFAILLAYTPNARDAEFAATRIHQAMKLPFKLKESVESCTASIGIVCNKIGYSQAEDFLQAADAAMHYAKKQETSNTAVFNRNMQLQVVARLQMEADLAQAIQLQRLHLNYQPIVSLITGEITAFEALVRWQHSKQGLISPNDFIPLAEETGLIIPLGQWVLMEACRQLRHWQEKLPKRLPVSISVNLSGIQLIQPDLVEQIDQILQAVDLNSSFLKIEITESVLMNNADKAAAVLKQLQERQIQLLLDDFGTGYSSLSYLHCLPINALKIDRSFIRQIAFESKNSDIVRTIVNLAHSLELDVIAEGVETEEQFMHLRSLGCEYGQGYFFSKALDSEAATALIAATD